MFKVTMNLSDVSKRYPSAWVEIKGERFHISELEHDNEAIDFNVNFGECTTNDDDIDGFRAYSITLSSSEINIYIKYFSNKYGPISPKYLEAVEHCNKLRKS